MDISIIFLIEMIQNDIQTFFKMDTLFIIYFIIQNIKYIQIQFFIYCFLFLVSAINKKIETENE